MESFGPRLAKVTLTMQWEDGTQTGATIMPDAESAWMQDGGPDGADLRYYSFGDQLDEIAGVVGQYQADNTPTHHYHVGHNMQGYSPDHEQITCLDTAEEARTALKSQLERAAEALPECVNPVDAAENESGLCEQQGCLGCGEVAALELFVGELEKSTATGEAANTRHCLNDGRTLSVVHWIEHTPAQDCEIDPDA